MVELGNKSVLDGLCPITYNEVNKLSQHYESMGITDNAKKNKSK